MSVHLSTFSPRLDGARADHGQSLGATGFVQAVQACRYESRNSATVHEQDRLPAPESSLFIPPCQDNTITTRSSTGENDPGGPSGPRCNAGVLDMWGYSCMELEPPATQPLARKLVSTPPVVGPLISQFPRIRAPMGIPRSLVSELSVLLETRRRRHNRWPRGRIVQSLSFFLTVARRAASRPVSCSRLFRAWGITDAPFYELLFICLLEQPLQHFIFGLPGACYSRHRRIPDS